MASRYSPRCGVWFTLVGCHTPLRGYEVSGLFMTGPAPAFRSIEWVLVYSNFPESVNSLFIPSIGWLCPVLDHNVFSKSNILHSLTLRNISFISSQTFLLLVVEKWERTISICYIIMSFGNSLNPHKWKAISSLRLISIPLMNNIFHKII